MSRGGGGSSADRDRSDAEDLIQTRSNTVATHTIAGQGQMGQHGALHALAHASQSHLRTRNNNIVEKGIDQLSNGDSDNQADLGGGNVDDVVCGTIKRKTQVRYTCNDL